MKENSLHVVVLWNQFLNLSNASFHAGEIKANWTKLSAEYFQKNRVQTQMHQNCGQFYYPVLDLLLHSGIT